MIVISLAIVLCAGIGVAATNVAHAAASRDRDRALIARAPTRWFGGAAHAAHRLEARAALAKTITFSPSLGQRRGRARPRRSSSRTALGKLDSVAVTGPDGRAIPGALTTSAHEWHSQGLLLPATSYRITAATVGRSGLRRRRRRRSVR